MSQTKARSALAERYLATTLGTELGTDGTEWENVKFDPSNRAAWASFDVMWGGGRMATAGDTGKDHLEAFLQISIKIPKDKAISDATFRADQLRTDFLAQKRLVYDGQYVNIRRVEIGNGFQIDDAYCLPVSIYFYVQIPRT